MMLAEIDRLRRCLELPGVAVKGHPTSEKRLDEVLRNLHEELEAGASAARVQEIAALHPDVHEDIITFAVEWTARSSPS